MDMVLSINDDGDIVHNNEIIKSDPEGFVEVKELTDEYRKRIYIDSIFIDVDTYQENDDDRNGNGSSRYEDEDLFLPSSLSDEERERNIVQLLSVKNNDLTRKALRMLSDSGERGSLLIRSWHESGVFGAGGYEKRVFLKTSHCIDYNNNGLTAFITPAGRRILPEAERTARIRQGKDEQKKINERFEKKWSSNKLDEVIRHTFKDAKIKMPRDLKHYIKELAVITIQQMNPDTPDDKVVNTLQEIIRGQIETQLEKKLGR